ncbi:hypothetical protein XENTR_v10009958 [Xenopus tropicalis]|nr:hypothetical protein XENTR_v10009958 [Xenopus tropicalis]KAE8619742.1 hypothetical protein XENTR_v10009958 [Xenopus tropicalis]KAE8619743.1 hypothetical protein XENTR_v10009958 [Xenopus tropicalis]KAE8619744.1 hypothetical protein XENTR_v10009958 [Xenopus tropicalis]
MATGLSPAESKGGSVHLLPVSHSPVIQRIRSQCSEPFGAFEQCLKENQASVENCTKHVTDFLRCAESVKLTE